MKKLSSRIPCGFNIWLGVVSEKNAFLGGNKSLKKTFEITNFFCWNHSHSLQRSVLFFRWNVILLMEETLHHLGCIKLQYLSTGSGFLPSTACGQQLSGQRQNLGQVCREKTSCKGRTVLNYQPTHQPTSTKYTLTDCSN